MVFVIPVKLRDLRAVFLPIRLLALAKLVVSNRASAKEQNYACPVYVAKTAELVTQGNCLVSLRYQQIQEGEASSITVVNKILTHIAVQSSRWQIGCMNAL